MFAISTMRRLQIICCLLAALPGCHTAPMSKYSGESYGGSMRWIASYGSMIYFEVDPVGEP